MWYLIGMLVTLAYFFAMPLIRYRQYWNGFLYTINIEKDLWKCLWGHFITSIIPDALDYHDYQRYVCDHGHNTPVTLVLFIILIICVGWIITVPILLLLVIAYFIKYSVEYYFQQKLKNGKEISNNTQ